MQKTIYTMAKVYNIIYFSNTTPTPFHPQTHGGSITREFGEVEVV
jgi:hypothetical protein